MRSDAFIAIGICQSTHVYSYIAGVLCITRPLSASCVMAQEHHERCALRAGEASEGHTPMNLCAACTKRQSSYHMQLYFLQYLLL